MKSKNDKMYVAALDAENKIIDYKSTQNHFITDKKGKMISLARIYNQQQLIDLLPISLFWYQLDSEGNSIDNGFCELTAENYQQFISGDSSLTISLIV